MMFRLTSFEAVVRQAVRRAIAGNGPAQRMVIGMVQTIEQEDATEVATKAAASASNPVHTDQQRARALAVFIAKTRQNTKTWDG
jgi:hypothetical protein